MVKNILLKDVEVKELNKLSSNENLFILFRPNQRGLKYYLVNSNLGIGVFNDELYVFEDGEVIFRMGIGYIDKMFSFEDD